jgi:hypothetical protein
MTMRYLALAAAILAAPVVNAQSAQASIAAGDSAYAALDPAAALAAYEAVVKTDSTNYEALWKASRTAVDLAEFEKDENRQEQLFALGETYARKAVAADSTDAEGYFTLARALGRVALTKGVKTRVKYGTEVRATALKALALDPKHPGALHVMGRWNAEIMRLSGFSRFIAKNFLGGKIFSEASWDNAVRYLEQSVAVDPNRLVHHLDLGEVYVDVDQPQKAREQFELVINGAAAEYNDHAYKDEARAQLAKLDDR